MREFRECVECIGVSDINHTGLHFTWNQRPNADTGFLKKVDRIMANNEFVSAFINSYAIFQPYRISDHCPAALKVPSKVVTKPKPFRFSNFIVEHELFQSTIKDGWNVEVKGHKMYCLVKKLRILKKPLRKLMWSKGNIHTRVITMRAELDNAQINLDKDPLNTDLRQVHSRILKEFNDASLDEEKFLKQKKLKLIGCVLGTITLATSIKL
ncbi:uncharacterized protein [Rutidosis leptorrhynchoides]|uniref:uncharacterized protein n=1 Tax=Rutidosis leptorrhynchoides TaxID=125765 RepID=UPI003A9A475E